MCYNNFQRDKSEKAHEKAVGSNSKELAKRKLAISDAQKYLNYIKDRLKDHTVYSVVVFSYE